MAERLRRARHRLDPTRVPRPCDRRERGRLAPTSGGLRGLLPALPHASLAREGQPGTGGPSNRPRPDASWRCRKSAVCITATIALPRSPPSRQRHRRPVVSPSAVVTRGLIHRLATSQTHRRRGRGNDPTGQRSAAMPTRDKFSVQRVMHARVDFSIGTASVRTSSRSISSARARRCTLP